MSGVWDFELDRARGVIRMTLAGFFAVEDVAVFDRDWAVALDRLGQAPGQHLTLCDVAGCTLSTADVVAALQGVIAKPRYRSVRCAMVVPGALARMQARRAVRRDGVAMFETRAAAEAWLLEPERAAA